MTGVWQTLIPETPSSEPITPLGGTEESSISITSGQNHFYHAATNNQVRSDANIMENNEKGRSITRCFAPLTYGHQLWR